jgi:DICT domain-containing protein
MNQFPPPAKLPIASCSLPTTDHQGATRILFDSTVATVAFEESDWHHVRQHAVVVMPPQRSVVLCRRLGLPAASDVP